MSDWFLALVEDVEAQSAEYQARRKAMPTMFGNGPDGSMDNTPEYGPKPLLSYGPDEDRGWLLWCVHKHPWPLEYIYCFGKAWDSAGERTDPLHTLDVRDLPKQYVGRLKIDAKTCRRNHSKIIGRALADGYDLHSHAVRIDAEAIARAFDRRARQHQARVAAARGMCFSCGGAPAAIGGECDLCSEIPF